MRRPSPAGHCLLPTTELAKTERDPSSTSGPSISVCAKPGDFCGQINLFLPAGRRPTVSHPLVAGGAQRKWLQTCMPDGLKARCLSSPYSGAKRILERHQLTGESGGRPSQPQGPPPFLARGTASRKGAAVLAPGKREWPVPAARSAARRHGQAGGVQAGGLRPSSGLILWRPRPGSFSSEVR